MYNHNFMKRILIFLFLCCGYHLGAQNDTLPAYFMEGEQVVLEFDIREYQGEKQTEFSKIFDLEGADIQTIIKEQKTWSKHGWNLKQKSKDVFQLCKDLSQFDQSIPWKSKYLIDGSDWARPVSEIKPDSSLISFFDIIPSPPLISETGNTSFFLQGNKAAKRVILAGSFNQWNEHEIMMKKTKDGWAIKLDLSQGIYEYKFIVDGEWTHDTKNKLKVENEHQTLNSILLVGETINFRLPGYTDAKRVVLSGSFNNWNEKAFPMQKDATGWFVKVPLPPGKHFYKFIINRNTWIPDPQNELQQPDRRGNWNSVLLVH